jgi:hypothetical protein
MSDYVIYEPFDDEIRSDIIDKETFTAMKNSMICINTCSELAMKMRIVIENYKYFEHQNFQITRLLPLVPVVRDVEGGRGRDVGGGGPRDGSGRLDLSILRRIGAQAGTAAARSGLWSTAVRRAAR